MAMIRLQPSAKSDGLFTGKYGKYCIVALFCRHVILVLFRKHFVYIRVALSYLHSRFVLVSVQCQVMLLACWTVGFTRFIGNCVLCTYVLPKLVVFCHIFSCNTFVFLCLLSSFLEVISLLSNMFKADIIVLHNIATASMPLTLLTCFEYVFRHVHLILLLADRFLLNIYNSLLDILQRD